MLLYALSAWRHAGGTRRRLEHSLLTLAAGLVIAFLIRWNYLPPRL